MKLDDLPAHIVPGVSRKATAMVGDAGFLLELQALALRHADAQAAATAVVSGLAVRLKSARVSLAWRKSARADRPVALAAVSHGGDSDDARRQAVRRLLDAAEEAMDHGAVVECPRATAAPGPMALAHAALMTEGGSACVLSVPFGLDSAMPGVLLFEQASALDDHSRQLIRDVALFIGPVLGLKARADAPWIERLRALSRPAGGADAGLRLGPGHVVVLAAVVGAAVTLLWPGVHHVVAPTRVEGLGQRIVTAPMDGFLHTVVVRPGESVKAGQVLATLDDRDPTLEVERSGAERVQAERQYGDALAKDEAGPIMAARARLDQLTAQHELALRRLERARLVAPFDGVLIGGDLGSSIGVPVKRGQELMIVAPTTGWRLVAEVDEQDVAHTRVGQQAHVLFAALPGKSIGFVVTRIAPVAMPAEGRNAFEVEGRLAEPVDGLRPGLRGVARIEAGERSRASVWWERGSNWARRMWWTFIS